MKQKQIIIQVCIITFLVCITSSAQTKKIACVGNSITEGSGLSSASTDAYPVLLQKKLGSGYSVTNLGRSGKTMLKNGDQPYWKEANFQQVFTVKPDIITIMLGSNDSKAVKNWNKHGSEFEGDYNAMIDTFSTISTHPKIVLCLPPASFQNSYTISDSIIRNHISPIIKYIAQKRKLPLIDTYTPFTYNKNLIPDGVHPNKSGHVMLADIFHEGIEYTMSSKSPTWLHLWYGSAPGPGALNGKDSTDKPRMYVFQAPDSIRNGAAVIICPGGAYDHLAIDKEGYKVAKWFNSCGITAFVLRYRFSPYRHPVPLDDAKRAMRLVRCQAVNYGIDSTRIGICGFSAGGHLASTLGTHFDSGDKSALDPIEQKNSRPDFMVLVYPVVTLKSPYTHTGSRNSLLGNSPNLSLIDSLSNELWVTPKTPQTFLAHGSSDKAVPIQNSNMFDSALAAKNVPKQFFIDQGKDHGYGLDGSWPKACLDWLKERKIIPSVGNNQMYSLHQDKDQLVSTSYMYNGALNIMISSPEPYNLTLFTLNGTQLTSFKGQGISTHIWQPPSAGMFCIRGTIGVTIVNRFVGGK